MYVVMCISLDSALYVVCWRMSRGLCSHFLRSGKIMQHRRWLRYRDVGRVPFVESYLQRVALLALVRHVRRHDNIYRNNPCIQHVVAAGAIPSTSTI